MADYYVNAATGNDANGGTDPITDAKLTVAAGVGLLAAGDTLWIEAGNYSQTVTTTVDDTRGGTTDALATVIRGRNGIPVITSATNSVALFTTDTGTAGYFTLRDVKLTHTAATRGVGLTGAGANATQPNWKLCNVEIDGCSVGVQDASRLTIRSMLGVIIRNCTSHGLSCQFATPSLVGCAFLDNGGNGVFLATNMNASLPDQIGNIYAGNAEAGLSYDASTRNGTVSFSGCIFADNGEDGLQLPVGSTGSITPRLYGNTFYGNGGYGVLCGTLGAAAGGVNRFNAYGGNTSGDHSGWFDGDDKISLSADPFVDLANGDFNINNDAGGGALLRAATLSL